MKDEHLLAGLTAMDKALREELIPSVRNRVDEKYLAQFEGESGVRRFTSGGKKLGRLDVSAEEWVDGCYEEEPCVADNEAFSDWMAENRYLWEDFVDAHIEEFLDFCISYSGELPGGVEMVKVHKPGYLKQGKTKFTVDGGLVEDAVSYFYSNSPVLDNAVQGLLEAGDE